MKMGPKTSDGRRSMTLPVRESAEGSPFSADRPSAGPSQVGRPNVRPRNLLLIGLDYGTTFTSVAYTYIKDGLASNGGSLEVRLALIEYITSWPAATETPFVPTTTLYDATDPEPAQPKWWGYKVAKALDRKSVAANSHEVNLAKLLLHEARETKDVTFRLKILADDMGKADIDFIGDFLSCLHEFLLGNDGYFRRHHSSWLDDVEIEFILGVPAAWSEPEQQAMIRAAIEAGFENPSRGSEPEAMAAIFFSQHETSLKIGDTFVICDAGGGTVDLITYTVAELNPLRVNEASVAEGVLCGSTYLNQRFRSLLKRRLEREEGLRNLDDILDQATSRFDLNSKKSFDGTEGESFSVPGLREDPERGFDEDRILLSCDDLKDEVFDPIVQQIEDIIRRQIQSSKDYARNEYESVYGNTDDYQPLQIKNIVLGGGFASNKYLFDVLRRSFDRNASPEERIEIQTLSSAGSTVARGLVLMASRYGLVKQRRSTVSCGIFTYIQYDKDVHGTEDVCEPVHDNYEEKHAPKEIKVIDWLVRKGQPLSQEVKFTKQRHKYISESTIGLNEQIFVSDHDTSAEEYTLMAQKPANCQEYKITTDFPMLSKEQHFQRRERPGGKKHYVVYWDVSLAIQHNEMIWSVILKTKTGDEIVTTHSPLSLKAEENKTRILGSLASRWAKGPVKPTSRFGRKPVFSKKRTIDEETGQERRKSSRIAARDPDLPIPSIEHEMLNGNADREGLNSQRQAQVPSNRQLSLEANEGPQFVVGGSAS